MDNLWIAIISVVVGLIIWAITYHIQSFIINNKHLNLRLIEESNKATELLVDEQKNKSADLNFKIKNLSYMGTTSKDTNEITKNEESFKFLIFSPNIVLEKMYEAAVKEKYYIGSNDHSSLLEDPIKDFEQTNVGWLIESILDCRNTLFIFNKKDKIFIEGILVCGQRKNSGQKIYERECARFQMSQDIYKK